VSAKGGQPVTLSGTLAGQLAFDGVRVTAPDLRIETPEGRIVLRGFVDVTGPNPGLDLQGRVDVDLARAARLIPATLIPPATSGEGPAVRGHIELVATARGSVASPTVDLVATGRDVAYGSLQRVRFVTKSSLEGNRARVHQLDVSSPWGSVQASGEIGLPGTATQPSRLVVGWMDVDLDRAVSSAGYTLATPIGARASGTAELRLASTGGSVSDLLSRLAADASVKLQPGPAADRRGAGMALGGQAQLRLKDGAWSIRHSLTAGNSTASLAGTINGRYRPDRSDSTLAGRTRLRVEDVGAAVAALSDAGISIPDLYSSSKGSIDSMLEAAGTTARPAVRATLAARDMRVADWPIGTADAMIFADLDGMRVHRLDARADPARLDASGDYAWSGRGNVRFDAHVTDVGELARRFQVTELALSGSARLEGHVAGTVDVPRGQGTLTVDGVAVEGTSIGRVAAVIALAGGRAQIDADAPALAARARVDLAVASPYDYAAEARFERTSISASIPATLRNRFAIGEGVVTGTVRASGMLSNPFEVAAKADLDEVELTLKGTRVRLQRPATLDVSPDRITAEHVDLVVGQTTRVQMVGTLASSSRWVAAAPLRLQVNGPLSDLTAIAGPLLPSETPIGADGTLALDLSVAGTMRAPEPSGSLTLRAAAAGYGELPPATDVALTATVDRARIVLQTFDATWQKARLSAQGVLPLRLLPVKSDQAGSWLSRWLSSLPDEPRSASLQARVTDITPAVLQPFLTPDMIREVGGRMVLAIAAEADALALDRVRGSAVLDEAELTLAGVPFKQMVPTRLRLQDGYASIADLHWDSLGNAIRASGGTSLAAEAPHVDVAVNGGLDLRVLGAFAPDIATGGTARADFTVSGPLRSPRIAGRIGVTNGELRLDTPRIVASELEGSVRIDDGRTAIVSMAGTVNGGAAELKGEVDVTTISAPTGRLTMLARNVALEYPEGLQTESNANVTFTLAPAGATLAGRVDILGGSYREPLLVSGQVISGLRQGIDSPAAALSPFLSRLRLDLTLASVEDVRIDNNYGRLDLSTRLRIVGSVERPGVIGRIEASPDGEIYLAGNTYRIERLIVDFATPRAIVPDLSFLAETRVGSTPIEVELTCAASGACERSVRSQAAGVTDEQAEEQLFGVSTDPSVAGGQLARLLSGEVLGIVGRRVGLDTLRLEQGGSGDLFDDPTLIAGDVDPASRLTLGERLGDSVELVYSQNLAESGFTWSTTYNAPYGLSFRALLLDDQSRSLEFRHEPRFGATRRGRSARQPGGRIGAVRFIGSPGFPERELRGRLKLTEGDRFQFAAWQRDRDRLADLYETRGFLEARIRVRRVPVGAPGADSTAEGTPRRPDSVPAAVALEYAIERGPETRLDVRGATLPAAVRERLRDRWSSTIFDGFLERDARTIVRDHLYRQGHLQATIATKLTADAAGDTKTLTIEIDPGPVVASRLEFDGNSHVATARLVEAAAAVGTLTAWIDAASFERSIERLYRDEGLLGADVDVQEPQTRNGTSTVRVVAREGQPYVVGRVDFQGADALPETEVREALRIVSGMRYQTAAVANGVDQVERRFRRAGFLEARAAVATKADATQPRVDIGVLVEAGPRSILQDVVVEGADPRKPLVAKAITLTPGGPVDPRALGETRRRLYDTGLYRSVTVDLQPLNPPAGETSAAKPDVPAAAGDRPVAARIQLEERPGYSLRYGLAFSDEVVGPEMREQRLGLAADLAKRNLFNPGTTAGLSARLRRDFQVGRFYLGSERFFTLPLRSNVFVSRSREQPESSEALAFVTDVTEIFGEQSYRLRRLLELRYGYGFGQNRTTIESEDIDVKFKVARLTSSALIDRRQNPFDPRGGWFSAAGFELSRPGLGSDISFVKGFLQYYQFVPVGSHVLVASAARVGLARTFEGQELVPSERFFAGGATTVRGYRHDDLGPRSLIGDNEAGGGRAMLILNAELRFPIYRLIRGVGFVDLGNVYPVVGDISFADLQTGVGAGLRFDTPVGVIRLDLGLPANPRAFDPKWKVHFGLGHAF
jgi:outer membrane protein assembly factor BamA